MARKGSAKKRATRRRTHRGGYYGFNGALATGAADWSRKSEMGEFVADGSRGGNNAILGAGRKRKSRKGSKKSRKTRRVKRGGGKYGGVSASFEGNGVAGMADYAGRTSRDNVGVANMGKFNNYGADSLQNSGSFITTK